MNTKWEGLWKQKRDGVYAGAVIKKSDIPKHTRIVLRYNKYYEKDSNKPKFVYCFADSSGYEEKCIPIEYEDSLQQKVDELAEVMRKGNHNADVIDLPTVTQGNAEALMNEAISLVEEITGEEWNFTYLT